MQQTHTICDHCTVEIDQDARATVTVQLDAVGDDPLHYCNPQCMLDNWHGRMDWYVEDECSTERPVPPHVPPTPEGYEDE